MDIDALKSEFTYKAVRSSGSGGQNVNKVASKVELYFNVSESNVFDDAQKDKLAKVLKKRINKDGILSLSSGESRSQFRNKTLITNRCIVLIKEALKEEKVRKKTKVPKAVKKKRLEKKKKTSEKKANRKPPKLD
ncbi:alternative ribosome rescue aminoacyl-tRNA hydrolase ArfB [Winogradskyella sp.]|uniref:alternative ribosome rescue aminoacyl-tRNA hydrolase ArfB n=1 Tax=Winogradskyella sp. TaxID=1883156 RepID=UPI003F6D17FB